MEPWCSNSCCSRVNSSKIRTYRLGAIKGAKENSCKKILTDSGWRLRDPIRSSFSHKSWLSHQRVQWASHSKQPACPCSPLWRPRRVWGGVVGWTAGGGAVAKVREPLWSGRTSTALTVGSPPLESWGHLASLKARSGVQRAATE